MMGQSDNIAKIRITPVPRGSGGSAFGWFQTVVGAVLMVASIWVPALAPLGFVTDDGRYGAKSYLRKPLTKV